MFFHYHLVLFLCSVLTCAFAPCGWMLASGDSGGEVIIWDIHAGTALYYKTIHDMGINCLLFLTTRDPGQGQHTMISAGSDCVITIWTISSNASECDVIITASYMHRMLDRILYNTKFWWVKTLVNLVKQMSFTNILSRLSN